jgi:mono/diheme cytochrome c family protein
MNDNAPASREPASISIFLDNGTEPISIHKPPVRFQLDTTKLSDGEHVLRIFATDTVGNVGVRQVRFIVANGPGITIEGLREGSRVRGMLDIDVNAFGSSEPFDPVRAESPAAIPVWTWVLIAVVVVWAGWYGIEYFPTPVAFAQTPTYAPNPALAIANAPATQSQAPTPAPVSANAAAGSKSVAGFDYATLGAQVFAQNCQSCHGADGKGVAGAFPPLAGDPVVNGPAEAHIKIVLTGLSGKTISGTHYAGQMPSFSAQLNDGQIAAAIDHERTSWGNHGATVTPEEVHRDR